MQPLPEHMDVLVTSADCRVEAISVKGRPHIVGFQSDNHAATPKNIESWIKSDEEWLSEGSLVDTVDMLKSAERMEEKIGKQFEVIFRNYIELT